MLFLPFVKSYLYKIIAAHKKTSLKKVLHLIKICDSLTKSFKNINPIFKQGNMKICKQSTIFIHNTLYLKQ